MSGFPVFETRYKGHSTRGREKRIRVGKRFLLLRGSLRRGLLFCSPLLSFGLEVERASPKGSKETENRNVLPASLDKPQGAGKITAFLCTWDGTGTMAQK